MLAVVMVSVVVVATHHSSNGFVGRAKVFQRNFTEPVLGLHDYFAFKIFSRDRLRLYYGVPSPPEHGCKSMWFDKVLVFPFLNKE